MLMPDRQAVLRDAVDQLLDAVGRGEVRSPSDCVRVLREMTDTPRPTAGGLTWDQCLAAAYEGCVEQLAKRVQELERDLAAAESRGYVRVLREMTEPRPCAGCGQPRVEPQEPCPHCDLGNVVPVTAEDLLGSVPPGDLRIHVPGLGVVDGREVTP